MIFTHVMFYIFSVLALLFAIGVVLLGNPVRSALCLVACFVCVACVWIILQAQFLGLILVLVYVGAVMTLFLFVVMMLNIQTAEHEKRLVRFLPGAFIAAILIFLLLLMAFLPRYFGVHEYAAQRGCQTMGACTLIKEQEADNVGTIGRVLYTDYLYPFELAGVILLVGMIAAIALAHRGPRTQRFQSPSEQVKVQKKDRLRIVNIKSEKPHDQS